jgi:asparagine synthase (glutamine-hydrolysing)
LKDFLADILLSRRARERGIFHMDAVEQLVLKERSFGRQVWGLLCLELWFRAFVDGEQLPNPRSVPEFTATGASLGI